MALGEVDLFETMTEATDALASRSYLALFTAYDLPDGDGLQLIAKARRRDRDLPVVLIQSRADANVRRVAARQRAVVVEEPVDPQTVEETAHAGLRRAAAFATRLDAVLDAYGRDGQLTPTWRRMASLGCVGVRRHDVAVAMNHSDGTYRKHVQLALATVGEEHWDHLLIRILIEVGGGSPPPRVGRPKLNRSR